MTLFESAVDGLKLAVGEQLAPVLRNIYEIGTNAFSWVTEFVEENEWIVGAITGVAVALGALTAGVTVLSVSPQIITALQEALALQEANPVVAVMAAAVATWSALQEAGESTKALIEFVEESKRRLTSLTNLCQGLRIDEINGKMNELQEEYEKNHAKARESIDSQLGLFNKLDG